MAIRLVGLCQRLDVDHTDGGDGPVKRMAHTCPISLYEEMVTLGGRLMLAKTMLRG